MRPTRSLLISIALLLVSLVLSSIASAQSSPVRARVTQAVDMQNLITLRGNVHPLAQPQFDQGAAPDDLPMERMLLVLQRGADQEAALRQLLEDQQVKSSTRFHQWLNPEEFGQQFGPADSDIQAVTGWLASQGFEVTKIAAGRTVIEFAGTAGLVRQVLGTEIHRFRMNDKDYWANTSNPQIPAALAPVVAGFASLNNFPRKPHSHSLGAFSRSKTTGEVKPLVTFITSNGVYYGLGPTDFATIYNVLPLWNASTPIDGTGQTIAVVGETNINLQDVTDFRSMFGLPASAPTPNIILNGPDPGITDEETEADLDVEWSGAVAKGATIDLVVSETTETTYGIDLSALYIVDNNLAPVMSISYGPCEAALGAGGNTFHRTLWEQAAAEGITVLVAAGDTGSATCDDGLSPVARAGFTVNGLASTPFNVAVGGTDFNDTESMSTYWAATNASPSQSSAKSYIPESTWNDACARSGTLTGCANAASDANFEKGADLTAGGGGLSNCINPGGTYPDLTCTGGGYAKPAWQTGTGVPGDGARDVPDVSLFSGAGLNYVFYVVCQMDANATNGGSSTSCDLSAPYANFLAVGGTSASAQVFAGVMALVNQAYGRQGNANFVLYPLAAQSEASCASSATMAAGANNSSCIFYDVITGNDSVACAGGSPECSNTSSASGQYGILVSGNPAAAAWTTTSGYDLATGLGSVNVANLVNKWTSNFTPSGITLSLATSPATNPITLTHGQSINFTVDVTSGSGTPSGDVSLIATTGSSASNATGVGPFTLSGGTATGSTIMLPGGSYNVTAHYAGNGTFAASDSTPGIPVTVSKESSQTEIRLVTLSTTAPPAYNLTTTPYGSPYILRMDVTNSSGQLCANATTGLISYPCPNGALTVSPAPTDENPPPGTVPGSYTLNSQGYAEDQPIQLPGGTYNFVASYVGDNSYTGSRSPTVPITITPAPTTTTLSASAASSDVLNLTATISTESNGIAPTGTVQFLNGSTSLGSTQVVNAYPYSATSGEPAGAVVPYQPMLPGGTYNITAQYSGDTNYAASTSAAVPVTLGYFSMALSPGSINISAPGGSENATITVTSLNKFAGSVDFSCAAVASAPGMTCTVTPYIVTLTSSGTQTATLTISTTSGSSGSTPSVKAKLPSVFRQPSNRSWSFAGLFALTLMVALITLSTILVSSPRRRLTATLFLATAALVAAVLVACGGGGAGGGGGGASTPPAVPAAALLPSSLTFSSQNVGSKSAAQSVTVTNTGSAALNISGITLTGTNAGDFSQTNTCTNTAVGVEANCAIAVTFGPTGAGNRTATVNVTDDASGSPQTVAMSGTAVVGTPTPAGTYTFSLGASASNYTFNSEQFTATVQ